MKKTILFFFLLLISLETYSQDTIIKYNGERIIGKVTEITPLEIKYKKAELMDGPVFVDYKGDINMIIFSNGVKEHFEKTFTKQNDYYMSPVNLNRPGYQPLGKIVPYGPHSKFNDNGKIISERDLLIMFKATNNPEILSLTNKAKEKKKRQYLGFGIFPCAIAAVAFGVSSSDKKAGEAGMAFYKVCTGVCIVGGISSVVYDIIVSSQRKSYVNKALTLYNEKY